MTSDSDFTLFQSKIQPTKTDIDYIRSIHTHLREYLKSDSEYGCFHVDTFLTGSYAKHTYIKPVKNDGRTDVDIIVVTTHTPADMPSEVLEELKDTLLKKAKYSTAKLQSHSIGISMEGIDIDVTPVAVNIYGDYFVGSSDDNTWTLTDPKRHIAWSTEVNKESNLKFKPLVKMMKWWRRKHCPSEVRYPKGIALEKIIADNIGDTLTSCEELVVETMRNIVDTYEPVIANQQMPKLVDPAVPDNDLLAKYQLQDLADYVDNISEHLELITREGTNNNTWRTIFGDDFPKEDTKRTADLTSIEELNKYRKVSYRQQSQYILPSHPSVFIRAEVTYPDGRKKRYQNNGETLPKRTTIYYTAGCGVKKPFQVQWQVVNTGEEAKANGCLRGGFEKSGNSGKGELTRMESTAYAGKHYVQCFIIKRGRCVARSEEFFINVE